MPKVDIRRIIDFLDDVIIRNGVESLTAIEANKLLKKAGLLRDSADRPGLPLRRLLRARKIPHAYQTSGKYSRWHIPRSNGNFLDGQSSERQIKNNTPSAFSGKSYNEIFLSLSTIGRDFRRSESLGFKGFLPITKLMESNCEEVPAIKGIYLVFNIGNPPRFFEKSVGGHFRGKDPTINVKDLESRWVKEAAVIYIGQAGGRNSNATLKGRLRQFMNFGKGEPVGHWGGKIYLAIKKSSRFNSLLENSDGS